MSNKVQNRKPERFKIGDQLRVTVKCSEYFGLTGELIEVTRFKDSGTLRFTEAELNKARRPERVLRAKREVYFYFTELKRV
jgi:hypothetical protein